METQLTENSNRPLPTFNGSMTKSPLIQVALERESLLHLLISVSAALGDYEVGWVQFECTESQTFIVSAMNQIMSIQVEGSFQIEGKGRFKVHGKQLLDYVKQLPQSSLVKLTIEVGNKMVVRCGRSQAKFQLLQDPNDVEVIIPDTSTQILIKGHELDFWISSFRDFVQVDDNRFYANGALLTVNHGQQNTIYAVASDAVRLSRSVLNSDNIEVMTSETHSVLVPKKVLDELKRLANQDPEEKLSLNFDEMGLYFAVTSKNYSMVARCISGKYPPYESAIPKDPKIQASIPISSFQESLKRTLLFTDKDKVVALEFEGNILKIASNTPGLKEGEEIVELEKEVSHPIKVHYNGSMLLSIVGALDGDSALFSWETPTRPVQITGEKSPHLDVFYLLVPINL